jgi:hypothetical protein
MPGSHLFGQGCRNCFSCPPGTIWKAAGLCSLEAIWLTSLLEAMPSLTVILSDWPMAWRIVSAISTAGLLVVGRQVEIAFVNRSLLHVRREIVGVAEHPVGKLLVAFVIARQDDELGAKLPRPRRRHRRVDAELPGLIRSRGDDAPAFTADGHGFAPQPRVGGLFNGREEGIRVEMNNGAGHTSVTRQYSPRP